MIRKLLLAFMFCSIIGTNTYSINRQVLGINESSLDAHERIMLSNDPMKAIVELKALGFTEEEIAQSIFLAGEKLRNESTDVPLVVWIKNNKVTVGIGVGAVVAFIACWKLGVFSKIKSWISNSNSPAQPNPVQSNPVAPQGQPQQAPGQQPVQPQVQQQQQLIQPSSVQLQQQNSALQNQTQQQVQPQGRHVQFGNVTNLATGSIQRDLSDLPQTSTRQLPPHLQDIVNRTRAQNLLSSDSHMQGVTDRLRAQAEQGRVLSTIIREGHLPTIGEVQNLRESFIQEAQQSYVQPPQQAQQLPANMPTTVLSSIQQPPTNEEEGGIIRRLAPGGRWDVFSERDQTWVRQEDFTE